MADKEDTKLEKIRNFLRDRKLLSQAMIIFYALILVRVIEWFMTLNDPSATQVAFITAIIGAAAAFFGIQ